MSGAVVTVRLTVRQAEALASWLAYLDAAPTDWEEANPANATAARQAAGKLARARIDNRRTLTTNESES